MHKKIGFEKKEHLFFFIFAIYMHFYAIIGLGDELSRYASTEPNEKVLAGLIAKNLNADHLTKKAAEASAEAK